MLYLAILLVIIALGAFAYIWATHGVKAAIAAFVALGGALAAGAAAFWHSIAGGGATP